MIRRQTLYLALVLSGLTAVVSAATIRIPGDGATIQDGIDLAVSGDTVLVAPGRYTENLNFRGKGILLTSRFLTSEDPADIAATIIDGSAPTHPDTASCVLFINGEDSSAILQGFTLTGGTGTRWPDIHIGGYYREGGGILIELASPTIRFNRITGNVAIDRSGVTSAGGGGIRRGDGNPRITNNVIIENEGRYGGGIVLNYSGGVIRNNVIARNTGGQDFGGAGIWAYENGPAEKIITNNTIAVNQSLGSGIYGGKGGGMLVWATTVVGLNNIVWGNTQTTGSPIHRIQASVQFRFSDVEGGFGGDGNLDIDPVFATSSFLLSPGSPCIDSGDSSATQQDQEDPAQPGQALWPSQGTVRNDMGAYGGPFAAPLPDFATTDVETGSPLPDRFTMGLNYPNPFNPNTTIAFSLPEKSRATLTIYNILGHSVARLVDDVMSPGAYTVQWDGRNHDGLAAASGVYFYRLSAGPFTATRRMVLLR